jgi:hypothetical protein
MNLESLSIEDPDSDKDNWRMYQGLFLKEWRWRSSVFQASGARSRDFERYLQLYNRLTGQKLRMPGR